MNDYLRKLFEGHNAEITESFEGTEISPHDVVMLGVDREAVERGHLQSYLREFEKLSKKKGEFRSRIIMSYNGYDFDPREVYQIPEVRKWASRLLTNVPHLFYFISKEAYSIRVIFLCLAETERRVGEQVALAKEPARRLIEKITRDAVSFSKKSGDSAEEQFRLANVIMEQCGYEHTS
ncbi:hypothetical protein [Paenibacillus apiarius]|uniref:hypothetical protein n=1 Tax=Paenibacillus apiarius TaxID=46240 RepID=UPI003B3AA900